MKPRHFLMASAFLGTLLVGAGAFSYDTRYEIRKRSGGFSELSGLDDQSLEKAHLDHTRNEHYDEAETGLEVRMIEHLAHHLYFRNNPGQIGLNKHENEWAIGKIRQRTWEWYARNDCVDQINTDLKEATEKWQQFYAIPKAA